MKYPLVSLEPTKLTKLISVINLYHIYNFWYSPTFTFMGESHEAIELVYIKSGSTVVNTPTYSRILNEGELIIHKPWEFHQIKANNTPCQVFVFSFSMVKNKFINSITGKVYTPTDIDKYYISYIANKGSILTKDQSPPSDKQSSLFLSEIQSVKNMLELLLLNIINQLYDKQPTPAPIALEKTIESPIVTQIISRMKTNITEKLSLKDIADISGYSISRLSTLFKKETGKSVINYFIELKIQKACELLGTKKLSIRATSEYLNFDSMQYFSTQFKKVMGIPPSIFIQQLKADVNDLSISFEKVGD